MAYMLVRHKVKSFATWKAAFDAGSGARQEMGYKGGQLLRNTDDPNETLILLEIDNVAKAREFASSESLRQTLRQAGITDQPDVYFLDEAARPEA